MAWRIAKSLDTLRSELNAQFPRRDKSTDGVIGNPAHAATASDHNPNSAGVVCGYDIDNDLDGTNDSNDPQMWELFNYMRLHPHRDLKYAIYQDSMFSAYQSGSYPPYTLRPYTKGGHWNHMHVSVGVGRDGQSAPGTYDHTDSWGVADCFAATPPKPPPAPPAQKPPEERMVRILKADTDTADQAIKAGTVYVVDADLQSAQQAPNEAWLKDAAFILGDRVLPPTAGAHVVDVAGVKVQEVGAEFLRPIVT